METLGLELAEQSEEPVDHVFCPAGGCGLVVAVARGFALMVERRRLAYSPAIECVQPEGNNTAAGPLREGAERARPVESTTRISGLQVPTVNDGDLLIQACRPTGGTGHLVTDEEVWELQGRLGAGGGDLLRTGSSRGRGRCAQCGEGRDRESGREGRLSGDRYWI